MIKRCEVKSNWAYQYYGARGVTVCKRWREDFYSFVADMGERPEGYTLDRIDSYGNYAPDNCRWADRKTQAKNHRLFRTNLSGMAGVILYKPYNCWRAYINIEGPKRIKHIGYYNDVEEAMSARLSVEIGNVLI